MTIDTVYYLLPEAVLVLAATAVYLGGAFLPGKRLWSCFALAGMAAAGAALVQQARWLPGSAAGGALLADAAGPVAFDTFALALRGLSLVVGLLFVLVLGDFGGRGQEPPATTDWVPETLGSLSMVVAGLMLVASARELVLLFAGLELVSIPTYVLLFLGRRGQTGPVVSAGREAAAKYFFLSILSSAVMLYGFSFLYGIAGSTQLRDIAGALLAAAGDRAPVEGRLALVFVVAGLSFRLAAVPFHFYAPDVYQGATSANAGLLSVAPKIAAVGALARLLLSSATGLEADGWKLALLLALLSMTVGNLLALWQNNVRRLLAYSSIAHGGYLSIGVATAFAGAAAGESAIAQAGLSATVMYLCVYAIAASGAFAVLSYLSGPDRHVETVDDLAGLARTQPLAAMLLALFMFSMAGIPPLAGFWGKFQLFTGAVRHGLDGPSPSGPWLLGLAIVGVLNAAIACAYYLRVTAALYFRDSTSAVRGEGSAASAQGGTGARWAGLLAGLLVALVGISPNFVANLAAEAASSLHADEAPAAETRRLDPPATGPAPRLSLSARAR